MYSVSELTIYTCTVLYSVHTSNIFVQTCKCLHTYTYLHVCSAHRVKYKLHTDFSPSFLLCIERREKRY